VTPPRAETLLDGRLPAVYADLRDLAHRYLSLERPGHTLQPTALVHEAYLRISAQTSRLDLDRAEIIAAAAGAMRLVLVDHARRRRAEKRGGSARRMPLDDVVASYEERAIDLVAVDEALSRLATFDAGLAKLVELRFFGGLAEEEIAAILGVSARTVRRGWRTARLWLARELGA
jgi:RNA polymerase sigma factor (TIGR02999 family)